jgi:response regulator RpfG family c-di-GMP phosphodiesterase
VNRIPVLCVDDEPHVIGGLALQLRRSYDVTSAHSGAEGLDMLQRKGPFAVVLSDMRMPGMDGAAFLAHARQVAPEAIRILLTGQADLASAIAAVNEGQIFRFLTKPCPPEQLRLAFDAAAEQHRLVTAERVLLEQTLHGSIRTLVDVLSLTNPVSFGRAMRVKRYVSELAERLEIRDRWQMEVAAMLSQIGCVVLPADTAEKVQYGQQLTPYEEQMASRVPLVTEQLLAHIPRLEPVRDILASASRAYTPSTTDRPAAANQIVEQGARILRVALDFDALETQGLAPAAAVDLMRSRVGRYDVDILDLLASLRGTPETPDRVRELPVAGIREGMILAEDLRSTSGTLLAVKGYEVTSSFVVRAQNIRPGTIREPVRVIVPAPGP